MTKLIGYARVSLQRSIDPQVVDLLAAGVDRDDLYVDHDPEGVREPRPQFHRALESLRRGDTLVITRLDRLARLTQKVFEVAKELQTRSAHLRILDLDGRGVDTATPEGSLVFTILASLGQMEHDVKTEQLTDSIARRRLAGKNLGGRPRRITDDQIRKALILVQSGDTANQAAGDLGISRATLYRRSRDLLN